MEGLGEHGHHASHGEGGRFELICGIVLTVFAAILAITELHAGNYRSEELIAYNEKANSYAWYNSKGIKQSLMEGQRDLLSSLLKAKALKPEMETVISQDFDALKKEIERFKKEKKEILEGSAKVGKENWVQDVDGEMRR